MTIIEGIKLPNVTFKTRTRIGSQEMVPVLEAFNIFLQHLSRDTDRIIITL